MKELIKLHMERKNTKEYINRNSFSPSSTINEVEAPMVSQVMSNLKMLKEADEDIPDFEDEISKDSMELMNNEDENNPQINDPEYQKQALEYLLNKYPS